MKNLLLVASMVAFLGKLQGDAINVTSTDFRIWGDWEEVAGIYDDWGDLIEKRHTSGEYFSSATGTGGHDGGFTSSPHGWSTGSAQLTPFGLSMQGYSYATQFWDSSADVEIAGGHGNIYATAVTQFRVDGYEAAVTISGDSDFTYYLHEQEMSVEIKDLTTGVSLLVLAGLDGDFEFSYIDHLTMNPNHDYQLVLSGWITAWDAKSVDMNTHVDIVSSASLPPPLSLPDSGNPAALLVGACLTLIGFGAGCRTLSARH